MYFDSKINKNSLAVRGNKDAQLSNEYFEKLEDLAARIDELEACTPFVSSLFPAGFICGYMFVKVKIKQLKKYLLHHSAVDDREDLLDSLDDISDELEDLEDEALLFDEGFCYDEDEDDEDEDDDFDEDEEDFDDDDDFDDFVDFDSDFDDNSDDDYDW